MKKAFFALAAVALVLALATLSCAKQDGLYDGKWKDKLDSGLRTEVESRSNIFSALSAPEKNIDVIVMTSDKNLERFGTVRKKFSIISAVSMSVPASGLERLARLDSVARIEKEKIFYIQRMEAIPLIRADSASSDFGVNGTNINISILDTGIFNHTEFQNPNRIILQYDFYNNNTNASDDNGHGTHVAGIAAGKGTTSYGRGVAANASIFAGKVCDASGACLGSAILSGIEWAVNNSAKIISMSLGGDEDGCSDSLVQAVDAATERGVLVVVSAGNTGPTNNTIASPACAKRALAVGSVKDGSYDATPTDSISDFSSRGSTNDNRTKPDLVAPGEWITSTYINPENCEPGINNEYCTIEGTSQAAPFVSGAAALVMEQYSKTFGYFPEPERVKAILLASANTSGMEAGGFANGGTPYRNNFYGSGRLDVYGALRAANFTANGSVSQGEQKMFYFNITNSNASVALVWGENGTTYNNLDLIVGNGTNNFTAGADRNDTVEQIFLRNVNNGIWNIYVNGTSVSGTQKFFIAYTQDNSPPRWSANFSYPASPANYSKNGNYSFNITWADDVAVDEVLFEWNGTANYSRRLGNLSACGSVFAANLTDLAAGNYSYRWLANDTSGKWNASAVWNYSIARAAPNVSVFLNGSAGNLTIASGDFVNITVISSGESNVSLYNNSSLVNNTLPPIYNIINYTGFAGMIFNITAFHNETQNFTSQNITSFIIIDGTPPVFSDNKTYPNSSAPYGLTCQFNITIFDETNISSVILEWNDTASIANYTVSTFSGSGSRNSTREYYYSLSNLSVGNHTYRWLANDSMNNTNSSQNFSYSIIRAASLSRLFLNGTENNRTYIFGEFANITALLNITGKNITVFANFSGSPEIIAGNNTSSVFNVTNTSNLNASSVYNITSAFSGDENYTASSVTYYLGLCPAACSASSESACSGGSKIVTTYSCGAPAYQCEPSPQTQSCSSGSSSGGGSIFAATVAAAANTSATISVTSYNGRITVSIPAVQANASEIINITNSSLQITKITISAAEKSANAKIEIRSASAPAAQNPEGEVFRYFSIEKTNLSLSRTDVEFFVTKKWASENQINVSTIALNRLSGNWIRLPTLRTAEDSANFYFNSSVPGFSYFAITGEKIKTEKAVPQQLEVNGTANNETEKEGAEKTENLPALFSALVSIGILLIIAAACFAVYTSRRKKIKGDKDGAQEQE